MLQELTLSYLPDGLNVLMRKNSRYTASDRDPCRERLFNENAPLFAHTGEVRVSSNVFIASTMSDWENSAVRFKHIGDGLKALGVIKEDNPSVIISFEVSQLHSWTKAGEKMVIQIEDLDRVGVLKRFKRPRQRKVCELIEWRGTHTGDSLYTVYQRGKDGREMVIVSAKASPEAAIEGLLKTDPTFEEIQ